MKKVPNLSISPEKVFFIIDEVASVRERRPLGLDLASDLSDDDMPGGDHSQTSDRSELSGFIRGLNEDEQIDLVALMWLGRGDGYRQLARSARARHRAPTTTAPPPI